MLEEDALNIFTDGSSRQNPRRGGIGIIYSYIDDDGNVVQEESLPQLGYKGATNNQMELVACINALKGAKSRLEKRRFSKIVIFTDSMYVVKNVKNAMFQWSRNHWVRQKGAPVLNAPQWKELIRCIRHTRKYVDFRWTKGHSDNEFNNAVDRLAKKSSNAAILQPLSTVILRRKNAKAKTKIGSIEMNGQEESIRIVNAEYLRIQKINRYRYEVVSRDSPDFGKVDVLCTKEEMKAGHSYVVEMNRNNDNPGITKIVEEVIPLAANVPEPEPRQCNKPLGSE